VLKTAAPGITHKSDVDGVRVGLADEDAVRIAYDDISGRLGPEVTVAAQVPPGIEMALGVIVDPTFGPLVLVGAGGVLVEVLHDRALALPPIDATGAHRIIGRLAVRPILDGVRGAEPSDVDALADAIARLSVLATDLGDVIAALDVNPVIVGPKVYSLHAPEVECIGKGKPHKHLMSSAARSRWPPPTRALRVASL